MSTPCAPNITNINRDDCIGTSRKDINNNFINLRNVVCSINKDQEKIEKRLKFLTPHRGILNYWGDITLGGLSFDSTGRGKFNMVSGQDLSSYALCNGNNGTPNLQDRFVVAAGGNYPQGELGPVFNSTASLQFSSVQLTIPEMPRHDHGVTDPTHDHTIVDNTHFHAYNDVSGDHGRFGAANGVTFPYASLGPGNIQTGRHPPTTSARQTLPTKALVSLINAKTNIDILDRGDNVPHENRPPYFALAYIMRIVF